MSTGVGDRPIERIHPLEIANAAKAVLAHQFSMPISALYSEVAKVFGVPRVTAKVEASIRDGIVHLAQVGGCKIGGEWVSVRAQ